VDSSGKITFNGYDTLEQAQHEIIAQEVKKIEEDAATNQTHTPGFNKDSIQA